MRLWRWQILAEPTATVPWGLPVALAILSLTTGCSTVVSSATGNLADSLSSAVLDQNDVETVRQGAPAFLLLVDGLIADSPKNEDLLLAGASLYSSYAGAFVGDPERAARLSVKGRDYGWRALCRSDKKACGIWSAPYDEFEPVINGMGRKQVPVLYESGAAWATWIQTHRDDWDAIADKARVDLMMQRVVTLDDSYREGAAHLYLGILATLLPEAMGGHPEEGRAEFERVIELSGGRNLMAKVLLAKTYARMTFDRELHDRLCREVLDADPVAPDLTLINTLAQEEATLMLETSEDYFGD
jgi:hypothetical protein